MKTITKKDQKINKLASNQKGSILEDNSKTDGSSKEFMQRGIKQYWKA